MANIYDKVPIKVQKKSGFDKSFQNLFTGKVGTIIPILTDEVIPNTTVNLRMAITTQLPPLASDTFMRVKQKYAAAPAGQKQSCHLCHSGQNPVYPAFHRNVRGVCFAN